MSEGPFSHDVGHFPHSTIETEMETVSYVITGKMTYYTACIVYADEDVETAEVINKLYKSVYPNATFFRPQFDMKRGRYELETTARVIQERCGGKTIFLLSEYFLANEVCQFAVNFAAAVCRGAGVGNLIPFHLTPNNDHVPPVLRGIAGIRWFRKVVRKYAWHMITETILANELQQRDLESVLERIDSLIHSEPSKFMSDPQYDEGTEPPGEPIKIQEPEGMDEILKRQHRCLEPLPTQNLENTNSESSNSRIKNIIKNAFSKLRKKFARTPKSCQAPVASNNKTSNEALVKKAGSTSPAITDKSKCQNGSIWEMDELNAKQSVSISNTTSDIKGNDRSDEGVVIRDASEKSLEDHNLTDAERKVSNCIKEHLVSGRSGSDCVKDGSCYSAQSDKAKGVLPMACTAYAKDDTERNDLSKDNHSFTSNDDLDIEPGATDLRAYQINAGYKESDVLNIRITETQNENLQESLGSSREPAEHDEETLI